MKVLNANIFFDPICFDVFLIISYRIATNLFYKKYTCCLIPVLNYLY